MDLARNETSARLASPIVELRQYTLKPRRRETLIDLFEREFIESQEAAGMTIIGQFRDLDRPDMFVWMRGFADMAARKEALTAFYSGPVWAAHKEAANATMIDSDDVLLLKPAWPGAGFDLSRVRRPACDGVENAIRSACLSLLRFRFIICIRAPKPTTPSVSKRMPPRCSRRTAPACLAPSSASMRKIPFRACRCDRPKTSFSASSASTTKTRAAGRKPPSPPCRHGRRFEAGRRQTRPGRRKHCGSRRHRDRYSASLAVIAPFRGQVPPNSMASAASLTWTGGRRLLQPVACSSA